MMMKMKMKMKMTRQELDESDDDKEVLSSSSSSSAAAASLESLRAQPGVMQDRENLTRLKMEMDRRQLDERGDNEDVSLSSPSSSLSLSLILNHHGPVRADKSHERTCSNCHGQKGSVIGTSYRGGWIHENTLEWFPAGSFFCASCAHRLHRGSNYQPFNVAAIQKLVLFFTDSNSSEIIMKYFIDSSEIEDIAHSFCVSVLKRWTEPGIEPRNMQPFVHAAFETGDTAWMFYIDMPQKYRAECHAALDQLQGRGTKVLIISCV